MRKDDHVQVSTEPTIVEITQRPRTTIGSYLSHTHTTESSHAGNSKRMTAPFTEEVFRQYNKLIQRMKKQKAAQKSDKEKQDETEEQ